MSSRSLFNDGRTSFPGQVQVDFSFLLNGTGPITIAKTATGTGYRGGGLLPGGSVVYQGSTGVYMVTLGQGYSFRYVVYPMADLDDTVNDGAYATVGSVLNEGTNTSIAFTLYTRAAAGTLTNYSARRCRVSMSCENSASG